jgi:hypothetical protein
MSSNKFEDDVNNLILEAKFGNRESLRKLWLLCQPVVDLNVKRFSNLVKGFRQYRDIFYNESYIFFWDIVSSFNFDGKYCFFYYLSEQLIEKTIQKIRGINILPEELIDRNKLLDYTELFEPILLERRALRDSLRNSTSKQIQAIYWKHFNGLSNEECGKRIGITYDNVRQRLVFIYRRTKRYTKRLIKNEHKRISKRSRKLPRQKSNPINKAKNGLAL